MAKVKFFKYAGSDPAFADFTDFAHLEFQEGVTARKAVLVDTETGNRLVLKGENLEYADGALSGRITSLTFTDSHSAKLVSITKARADGDTLWSAYDGGDGFGDLYGMLGYVLRGRDTITGSSKIDYLSGFEGKNTIRAGGGNDRLDGGEGKDRLFGAGGKDEFYGYGGNDRMTGGKGSDSFYFYGQSGKDVITDFDAKGGGNRQDYLMLYSEDTFTVKKAGDDVLIKFDDGDTIRLLDVPFRQFDRDVDIRLFDMA